MTAHGPLCPFSVTQQTGCKCYWIDLGRADERERMKANLSGVYAGIRASAEAEVRERIAQEPCSHDLSMHDAKIRADERQRLRAQVEAYFTDAYSKARYTHANDPDRRHYWEGYRDALDIAEQAFLALLGGDS